MNSILAVLVLAGLAVYLWRECKPFLDRALKTREQTVQIEAESSKPLPPPTPREALPRDLRIICEQWRDPWAREQAMDYYCEVYDQTKNWNAVLTAAMSDQVKKLAS